MPTDMNAGQIVLQIVNAVQRQAEAIACDDYTVVEALTTETASLCQALDRASMNLPDDERARLSGMLQAAIDQAAGLVTTASSRLGETRQEIQEIRHGKSATSAYRQAVPRVAAMSYSRQG
ncbi:MAG: flagellar protein FliT [Thermomicrobiales bacterium]